MINVKNIHHEYENKIIIGDFSYIFEDNNIYCIMGESGCGKSTLVKIISNLLIPTSGEVLYLGKKVVKTNTDIFMMSQGYTNFPWKTALENILFPLKIKKLNVSNYIKIAYELLKTVGLDGNEDKYPAELSGGQRQRLALARVLISRPKVILMDEPLSALDEITRKDMQDLLIQFQKQTKCLIIMITHDKSEAERIITKPIIHLTKYKEV